MDATWPAVNWHRNNFRSRQLISFIISILLTLLILLIPLKFDFSFSNNETSLTVQLVKTKPEIINQEVIKPEPVIETIKPVNKIKDEPKKQTKEKVIQKPVVSIIKTINREPIKTEPNLPRVGVILNSMENNRKYIKLDEDFQVASDDPYDFKFKQIVKPKAKKQFIINNDKLGVNVTEYTPVAMKALKIAAGYLSLAPIDDVEKKRGSLNYCHTLGRKAHYCPTSNPLVD